MVTTHPSRHGSASLAPFVEQVLAQSQTTAAVLTVALAYINGLRSHIASSRCAVGVQGNARSSTVAPLLESWVILLCPRRVFVTALILAWKIVEDRPLAIRHWANICGIPACELARCERIVGSALDWRLWSFRQNDTFTVALA